ncbi:hypothetical protein B0H11DRAFT_2284568 [Mycena galericulata]|nr:hypothetical protein B0H11DRAFT_2284568 [Mycena galericulata]
MTSASRFGARGYPHLDGAAGIRTLLSVTVVSTLTYGAYFVLFVIAVYLHSLARDQHTSTASALRSPVFIGTISLFITITTHWVMTIIAVYTAFQTSPDSPFFAFYQDPLPPVALVRNIFLLLSWSIGDLIIIHRLWIVWSRDKFVIIVPLCTWLGLIATGIGQNVDSYLHYQAPTEIFSVVRGWFTSQLVLTLWCVLILFTVPVSTALGLAAVVADQAPVLIAYRILRDDHLDAGGGKRSALMTTLAKIVESALMCTVWTITNFVSFQTHAAASFWVFESSAAVVGVVNMLIHVRVGLGWAQGTCRVSASPGLGVEFGTISGQLSTGFESASALSARLELEPGGMAGSETELEEFKVDTGDTDSGRT